MIFKIIKTKDSQHKNNLVLSHKKLNIQKIKMKK